MNITKTAAAALCCTALATGCASIISGSTDDITVQTTPAAADCSVYKGDYLLGHVNPTPGTIVVKRSSETLLVKCSKPDYEDASETNTAGINGWVFGNIIFGLLGGPIGAAIDASTGSINEYDATTVLTLTKVPAAIVEQPTPDPVS